MAGPAIATLLLGCITPVFAYLVLRLTLSDANPTFSLTCALGITFPFNILAGIPLYHQMAHWLGS